ncbi:hypothetical protein Tco_0557694, partial [Tanacetum coccineum]
PHPHHRYHLRKAPPPPHHHHHPYRQGNQLDPPRDPHRPPPATPVASAQEHSLVGEVTTASRGQVCSQAMVEPNKQPLCKHMGPLA